MRPERTISAVGLRERKSPQMDSNHHLTRLLIAASTANFTGSRNPVRLFGLQGDAYSLRDSNSHRQVPHTCASASWAKGANLKGLEAHYGFGGVFDWHRILTTRHTVPAVVVFTSLLSTHGEIRTLT